MFQNISFTFLCALAFISWSLLCYLDAIEDRQIHNDYKVELYTERPTFSEAPKDCEIKSTDSHMIHRIFDWVITYSLILMAIIAISMSLQWLELKITAWMLASLSNIVTPIFPYVKYSPIESVEDNNKETNETVEIVNDRLLEDEYTVGHEWTPEKSWEVEEEWAMDDNWQMEEKWTTGENRETHEGNMVLQQKWNDDRNMEENVNGAENMDTQPNMGELQNWENSQREKTMCSQLPQYHKKNIELKEQLDDLRERCRELLQELRAVNKQNESSCTELQPNPSNSSFSSSDDSSGVIVWKQPVVNSSSGLSIASTPDSSSHNVYVTHSHYHININGPVQLTKQDINVGMPSTNKLHRRSEFLQVWGTFIKGPEKHPMLTDVNNILI